MSRNINILIVQNHIKSDDITSNREHVYSLIENYFLTKNLRSDLILLPEFFTGTPWYFPGKMHLKGIVDETIPGPTTDMFANLARKYNTYIVCGSLVERVDNKYYNTAALIAPTGKIVGKYRKTHRYASETNHIEQSNDFPLFDTELGKIGIVLCSDFWVMEVPRIMTLKGADLLAVPANSLLQNINTTVEAVVGTSVLNAIPIAYASTVSKVSGMREGKMFTIDFRGHSSLVTPKEVICRAYEDETVLFGSLDMDYLSTLKHPVDMAKDTVWWGLWGRRPELYNSIMERYSKQEFDLTEWFQKKTRQEN